MSASGTPLHIVVNPHAGGGRAARLVPALQQWAAAHTPSPAVQVADTVPQALACLQALPRGSLVALVGGDGTIHHMLPALLHKDLALAVVPQGSGNDVARGLGVYGLSWQDALQCALHTAPRAMDAGWLRTPLIERPFVSSLTVGFDSAVGYRALHGPRWLRGLPRYLLATLRELSALHTWDMRVHLDGTLVHSGRALFASSLNTPTYGSGMPAVPQAQMHDGRLNLLLAGAFNVPQTLVMLPRLLMARHLQHPRVQTRPFQTLDIASPQPLPLAADGEYLGESTTLSVQVAPGALRVVRR